MELSGFCTFMQAYHVSLEGFLALLYRIQGQPSLEGGTRDEDALPRGYTK